MKTGRNAFALVDLQFLLAVGAIALSLFLPAVQSQREISRNAACQNRIGFLALAGLEFELTNGRLPAELSATGAVSDADWTDITPNPDSFYYNQHTSIFVKLLPFIGRGELLDNVDPFVIDFDESIFSNDQYADISDFWFGINSGAENLMVDLEEVTCPSDNINDIPMHALGQVIALYSNSPGEDEFPGMVIWLDNEGDGRFTGQRTNYVGCFGAGTGGDNRGGDLGAFRGAIGHREVRTLFSIPDGASSTVMLGENVGVIQWTPPGETIRDHGRYWFMGANSIGRGGVGWKQDPPYNTTTGIAGFWSLLNADNPEYPNPADEPDPRQGILGTAFHARANGFGSLHRSGVNFAMLDGSVKQIRPTDNWQMLYSLFGAFDSVRPGLRLSN